MKTKTLRNSFLIVVVTFTFPSVAQAQNPPPSKKETITKTTKTVIKPNLLQVRRCGPSVPFKPFEMADLSTRQPIAADGTITLPSGKRVPAQKLLDRVNEFEKSLTQIGCSLRSSSESKKTVILEIPLNRPLIESQVGAAPTPNPQLPLMENFWESDKALFARQPIQIEESDLAKSRVDIKVDRRKLVEINSKISAAGVKGIKQEGLVIGDGVGKLASVIRCEPCPPPPPCTPINDSKGWNWNVGDPSTFSAYINVSLTLGGNACMPPDMNNFNNNQSHFEVSGEAKAGGSIFGESGDFIRATASVSDNRSNNTETAAVGVFSLGEELFSKNETGTGHWQSQENVSKPVDFSTSTTINLLVVDVDLKAGVRGNAGFRYSMFLDPMTVSLSSEPVVHVNGYGQAGVSTLWDTVEAGVRVNLTLLDWDMHLSAKTGVGWHIWGSVAYDDVYFDSNLTLLKGSFDVYVRVWPFGEYDASLWSWDGFQFNSVVLNQRNRIPVWRGPSGQ